MAPAYSPARRRRLPDGSAPRRQRRSLRSPVADFGRAEINTGSSSSGNRTPAEDHPALALSEMVSKNFARALGLRIDVWRRASISSSADHSRWRYDVEQGAVRAAQRFRQHESQLDFNPRHDKTIGWECRYHREKHIIEQRAVVVQLANLRALHRFEGQADLVLSAPALRRSSSRPTRAGRRRRPQW